MKPLCAALAALLLGLAAGACGGGGHNGGYGRSSRNMAAAGGGTARAAQALPQIELKGDDDSDSDNYPHEPQNDNENELLGHPAGSSDVQAVTDVIRRYYADAAAGDGAEGCRLIYAPLAESVAETYGGPAGAKGLGGSTCGAVLSKLFRLHRAQLGVDDATLKVGQVRVAGNRGSVRLGFDRKNVGHYLPLHRERGGWKVSALLDIERPIRIE